MHAPRQCTITVVIVQMRKPYLFLMITIRHLMPLMSDISNEKTVPVSHDGET